ncbi:c-type cytochrome [Halocynthiibacter namhaensis]|uniref:c-type cytochrome n=1 Tax=Halocynthiibacter namhaensis TaxID=1290553 RepID=UPI0005796CA8|nr:cytochrome c family protein [Halocynthiibacter namhaensis]
MFDTMTFTKILGGFCGAFLIFLLGNWAGESLYHTGGGEGGHGEAHADAYPIETGDDHGGEPVEEVDFATLLAAADIGKGERVFNKCRSCHSIEDGVNGTGPSLFGVVERDVASAAGFGFSGALDGIEGNWTPEALSAFLQSPKGFAPGTAMSFNGLPKETDRANIIAWLATLN